MMSKRVGLYPGTFDPPTNGHSDIILRAAKLVDELIVGVAGNAGKGPLFGIEERIAMVEEEVGAMPDRQLADRIRVQRMDGLLIHYAQNNGVNIIVRGLRAVSDFEYEFQMAGMNRRLDEHIETAFLMASEKHQFISSRFVKEIGGLDGDVTQFVSPRVRERLQRRFGDGAKVLAGAASKAY